MNTFPENIKFKYPWRKYQKRVLDELNEHINDDHLHIIAPPGSGKTVLGIEVALRLNKPTLILAPTLAIRNQWIQRFCELFLNTHQLPNWISANIYDPKFCTIITYQALHAAYNNMLFEEKEIVEEENHPEINTFVKIKYFNVINELSNLQIKTLIVDEAHHLKNEWWRTLIKIKEKLNPVIVGLTATPPYDVTPQEWQRYLELNGPVDTEISIPELIIEDDLCPHQDYIYFTSPSEKELEGIENFRINSQIQFEAIKKDEDLIKAVETHPIWLDPEANIEWIYSNLECYSACLIFLHSNQKIIPQSHIEVIDEETIVIPELDTEWLEQLLTFYLFIEDKHFKQFNEHREKLINRLKRYGIIENKRINFLHNQHLTNLLSTSISKLDAIKQIAQFEYNILQRSLRLVILTDFIRKEFININNEKDLNKIGVLPIFKKLLNEETLTKKIGILTGSIVIIPKTAVSSFERKCLKYNVTDISYTDLPESTDFTIINLNELLKKDIVHIITQIFQSGEIEILIGTKSLLGEGWDAPAINSLIMASFVGSFVLSNQMRGRAIRKFMKDSDKTSNVWHLACIDPTSLSGGDDFELLKRRFRSFVGVSLYETPTIENGINRLNIPKEIYKYEILTEKNVETLKFAADRSTLKERWMKAISGGIKLVEEIKIPFHENKNFRTKKSLYLNKTIANLIFTLTSILMIYIEWILNTIVRSINTIKNFSDFLVFLSFVGIVGVFAFGGLTINTFRLYLKYRDISKDLYNIGLSLLHSLAKADILKTNIDFIVLKATVDDVGAVYCHLEGATTFETSSFINSLQEIIQPVGSPKYIIIRKSKFIGIKQLDYHGVPEILAKNKSLSEYFHQQWLKYVGDAELVYTRTREGRKMILQARLKSLAAQFDDEIEHLNKWR